MDQRVWLGAAALGLALALVGVLALTGGEAEDRPLAYDVAWLVEQGPATTREDELEEGRSQTYTFDVRQANVTNVSVRLDWDDDVGQPDTFTVEVRPPEDPAAVNTSENETIDLRFAVGQAPRLAVLEATNRSQARDRVAEEASSAGQGSWEIEVTLEDAPGHRPLPGTQLETEPDGANDYELTFTYDVFHAEIGDPRPPDPDG